MQPSDFSSLYQSSYSYIYQLVFSVSHDRQSAEDTVQEIYLAAWIRFRGKTHPNPFGWLVITARHKACDALRRRMREARYVFPMNSEADSQLLHLAADAYSGGHCGESETAYGRIRLLLRQEEFNLILAHYEYGVPVAELADKLNISPGACYMRLHRARRKLEPLAAPHLSISGEPSSVSSQAPQAPPSSRTSQAP